MNGFVKALIVLPLMAGSAAAGYFVAKKKYQKLADKEIANVKQTLEKYYKGSEEKKEPVKKEEVKSTTETKSSIFDNHKTESEYVNYAKPYITESVEKKLEAKEEVCSQNKVSAIPYIIGEREYENSNFIARSLYYYTDGQILTDSDGRHIDNATELLGNAAMKELLTGNIDTLYVRNELLEADFEVIVRESLSKIPPNERIIPEEYEEPHI